MPITKTKTIKSENNLKRAIKYILNPDKTDELVLTSSHKINYLNNADYEMMLTRNFARETLKTERKNEVLARHLIQSFDPKDNLTPEQIHEIGRQTILELTGGSHEFVIATHVDQEHIHNHIIFNATNFVDLKKFRWQKGTPSLLRNISDKQADFAGAMVLDDAKRNSYTKYQKWRNKNNYRVTIKERLDFLMKHAKDIEEFKTKAKLLNVGIDFSGKYAKYKLLDFPQQRPARDDSMSNKKRKYSLENIAERLTHNQVVYNLAEVVSEFQKIQDEKISNPDIRLVVEPWQIKKDTMTGIYVEVEYGRRQKGLIKIPDYKIDRLNNGNYEVYINKADYFYFLDEKDKPKSKFMKGVTLIEQLSHDNKQVPLRQNAAMKRVRDAVAAINLLSERGIKGESALNALGEQFISDVEAIENAMSIIEDKLGRLNQYVKFDKSDIDNRTEAKALQNEYRQLQESYQLLKKKLDTVDFVQEKTAEQKEEREL
ncbi:relaxase/mobilization nuclease domain-containing protein [Pseudolactococcus yaeyamensis]